MYENLNDAIPPSNRSKVGPSTSAALGPSANAPIQIYEGAHSSESPGVGGPRPGEAGIADTAAQTAKSVQPNLGVTQPPPKIQTKGIDTGPIAAKGGPSNQGATQWFKDQSKTHKKQKEDEKVESLFNMRADQLTLAVWESVYMGETGRLFAFGVNGTFEGYKKGNVEEIGQPAVGGPNPLIMPISFEASGKGLIGHHLLALAEVTADGQIKITIMDSRPGTVKLETVHKYAFNIVRNSGWLGIDNTPGPLPVFPVFSDVIEDYITPI